MRPAPMFRWPTFESPICPSISPTSRPLAANRLHRIGRHQPVEDGRLRGRHGVAAGRRVECEAVHDDQDGRRWRIQGGLPPHMRLKLDDLGKRRSVKARAAHESAVDLGSLA